MFKFSKVLTEADFKLYIYRQLLGDQWTVYARLRNYHTKRGKERTGQEKAGKDNIPIPCTQKLKTGTIKTHKSKSAEKRKSSSLVSPPLPKRWPEINHGILTVSDLIALSKIRFIPGGSYIYWLIHFPPESTATNVCPSRRNSAETFPVIYLKAQQWSGKKIYMRYVGTALWHY